MTEQELLELVNDTPFTLPCTMADGRVALLVFSPIAGDADRQFGFQVPGEEDIRWLDAERIAHVGSRSLSELPVA